MEPGFPGIARIGLPGRRPVTAALRTLKRDPDFRTLHCLLIRAAATSRAIARGRLLILLIKAFVAFAELRRGWEASVLAASPAIRSAPLEASRMEPFD